VESPATGARLRLAAGGVAHPGPGGVGCNSGSAAAIRRVVRATFGLPTQPRSSINSKRQKLPYRLADNGATIEVPDEQVHETRLTLMSAGVPLSGWSIREYFDKQSLGVTDQSQRVSYQRALQGELARTIGALEDVKQARVHLVLPDSTLFKRDRQEARAAVSVDSEEWRDAEPEQILGVQTASWLHQLRVWIRPRW